MAEDTDRREVYRCFSHSGNDQMLVMTAVNKYSCYADFRIMSRNTIVKSALDREDAQRLIDQLQEWVDSESEGS